MQSRGNIAFVDRPRERNVCQPLFRYLFTQKLRILAVSVENEPDRLFAKTCSHVNEVRNVVDLLHRASVYNGSPI